MEEVKTAEHKLYCRVVGINSIAGTILDSSGLASCARAISEGDYVVITCNKVAADYAEIMGDILKALDYFNLNSIQIQNQFGKILYVRNNPAPRVVFHEPG